MPILDFVALAIFGIGLMSMIYTKRDLHNFCHLYLIGFALIWPLGVWWQLFWILIGLDNTIQHVVHVFQWNSWISHGYFKSIPDGTYDGEVFTKNNTKLKLWVTPLHRFFVTFLGMGK